MVSKELDSCESLEKRKFERFTYVVAISSKGSYGRSECLGTGKSEYVILPGFGRQKAKLVDLSLGGAKLLTGNPVGTGVEITIYMGGTHNASLIEVKARVVWCKNVKSESDAYHVGAAFHSLRWRKRFQLKKIVKLLSM